MFQASPWWRGSFIDCFTANSFPRKFGHWTFVLRWDANQCYVFVQWNLLSEFLSIVLLRKFLLYGIVWFCMRKSNFFFGAYWWVLGFQNPGILAVWIATYPTKGSLSSKEPIIMFKSVIHGLALSFLFFGNCNLTPSLLIPTVKLPELNLQLSFPGFSVAKLTKKSQIVDCF